MCRKSMRRSGRESEGRMIYPFLVLWVVALVVWGVRRLLKRTRARRFLFKYLHFRKFQQKHMNQNNRIILVTAISLICICAIALFFVEDKGGLIGSAIGGIGTLIAVLVTIKSGAEQQEKSKETILRPYLTIKSIEAILSTIEPGPAEKVSKDVKAPELVDYWSVWLTDIIPDGVYECMLKITFCNVGVGPAITLKRLYICGAEVVDSCQLSDVPEAGIFSLHYFARIANDSSAADDHIEFALIYQSIVGCEYKQCLTLGIDEETAETGVNALVIKISQLSNQEVIIK